MNNFKVDPDHIYGAGKVPERPTDDLAGRAAKGGMWVFATKITHRALGLIRTIILARLLSPSDFGLFGIAVLAINLLENFSVTGVNAALIQKKEDIRQYLDSAWTVNLLRGVILFAILYIASPAIAHFFKTPGAAAVIKAIAFLQLLTGLQNIGIVYFQKEIRFEKIFLLKFASLIANIAVSITLAVKLRNVWALVWGSLSGELVKAAVSYIIHPYRPGIRFDRQRLGELLNFGKWLFGSNILMFLITQGDDAFVGKILGIASLGLYQMAYRFSNAPATEISNFISQVTFPVYSKLQEDIERLRDAYFKVLKVVSFLSFPIAGMILMLAPDFTRLFLGHKWMPMVPAMRILAFWGLTRSIGTTTTQVFYARGRPDIVTKLRSLELFLIVCLIYPLSVRWGIAGTALAIVVATFLPISLSCYNTIRMVKGDYLRFLSTFFLPLANTAALIGTIFVLGKIWKGNFFFFMALLAGAAVYLLITVLFNRFFNYDIWYIFRKIKEQVGKK